MPHFFVRDIAADYALRGQRKPGSSPETSTLLYLIVSCFHCRDIVGVPPPVTLNPFVRKYVASEGYVAYSTPHRLLPAGPADPYICIHTTCRPRELVRFGSRG
jgi:hypothetical protein